MELGVAPADVPAVLRAVAEVARQFPFSGLMAVRYVKASSALLAFTNALFGPVAATIEIPCAGSPRSLEAFDRIWEALDRACYSPFVSLGPVLAARLQPRADRGTLRRPRRSTG